MEKLTVIITTYNEIEHIKEAIASVKWADEIIVVDSFSQDGTVEAAKTMGAHVLEHEYESPAAQKNWAIPQAKYDWILILDADERATPALQKEIQAILRQGPKARAYKIFRINHFMGEAVHYSGWQSDAVIRFFHKDYCRYEEKQVHEKLKVEGKIEHLKNKLLHYTYKDLHSYLQKMDRYTSWGAYDREQKVKAVKSYHLFIKPVSRFFIHYIIKLGFLDGRVGLIVSMLSAYSVFIRNLKLLRLKAGEKFPH